MRPDINNLRHTKAGIPTTRYIYRDKAGKPDLIANRYDKAKGGKFFLPYDVERGEWKAPEVRPIYNLDKIAAADPATSILFVEGEKCADALAALGYLTTTTFGGSNGSAKADLSPLAGRNVYVWPDNDDAGRAYADKIADTLRKRYVTGTAIIPISPVMLRNVYVGGKRCADHTVAA